MKAIENVREKANQVINRYGKVIFTFLIFFTLLGTAQVAEAQSGLKINSLSEVTDKAKEGADTILDVAKYILAAVLGIALVFVIYSLATNNPHAKEYLLGWIIAWTFTIFFPSGPVSNGLNFIGIALQMLGLLLVLGESVMGSKEEKAAE